MGNIAPYLKKNWFTFFAILVYGFFVFYYMGPSVTSCNTTVYGFGDNTAGPIWQASLPEKQGPIGSFTSMTNAPYGDNLENPIGYSLIAQSLYIKTMTTVAGPICGYNIANMTGFMLSALVMFGFILAVTKNRWIALLAGYAVSFAPYFQLKIGAHFSFGFQAIFIGIFWSFYNLVKKHRKRDAIIFALLSVLGIYWDPYYSLLIALIVFPLGITWLVLNRKVFLKRFWARKADGLSTKRQLKLLLISAGIVFLLLLPLVMVFINQGKQISNNVSASRGNILLETQYCSNWPHEYFVPFMFNPIFEAIAGKDRYDVTVSMMRDHYSCGIGEDVVGLSITLSVIALICFIVIIWDRLNRRRVGMGQLLGCEPKILIYGLMAVGLACLLLGLPPMIRHGIPTPSYEMLQITSTWRTITRIFVVLNIVMITLASISMVYFVDKLKLVKNKRLIVVAFVLIFGAVIIEYQTAKLPFRGNDFGTFDYTKSVPKQYNWLKEQKDIGTIAEYPLERSGGEGNSMAYYLTMQVVHGKKLFNGSLGYTTQEQKKTGLKDLYDPQTIPVLKSMGIDAIVVHGITKEEAQKIPYGKIIYTAEPNGFTLVGFSPLVQTDNVYIISLKDVTEKQSYILAPQEGFYRNMTYVRSAVDWRYLSAPKSTINIVSLSGDKDDQDREVCFGVQTAGQGISTLKLWSSGHVVQQLDINTSPQQVRFIANGSVTLDSNSQDGVVVSNLGCNQ